MEEFSGPYLFQFKQVLLRSFLTGWCVLHKSACGTDLAQWHLHLILTSQGQKVVITSEQNMFGTLTVTFLFCE